MLHEAGAPGGQQQHLGAEPKPTGTAEGNAGPSTAIRISHQRPAEKRQVWVSTLGPLGHCMLPWPPLLDTLTLWQLDASFAKMLMRQGSVTRVTQGAPGPAGTLLQSVPTRHPHPLASSLRCGW